jgi:carbon monoxide dehydrogenase subunit G
LASIRKVIVTDASPEDVWAAVEDVGALHTRLAPGFVVDTLLEPGARIVTFGNGVVVKEPIVTLDAAARRLVWSAEGGRTTHYNASIEVKAADNGKTEVVWVADFLPNEMEAAMGAAMSSGSEAMKAALDKLAK